MSKIHDCERNSSPMILIGNQMVYSWNWGITSLVTIWLYMLITTTERRGTKREHLIPCVASSLFCHFQNRKETRAELTFAKTSGTVTRDRERKRPIADWHVPSNDPTNNCGTHFGSSPLLASRMANENYNRRKNFKSRPFFSVHANADRKVEHSFANSWDSGLPKKRD